MEVLYCIITILLIVMFIVLMMLLFFRNKKRGRDDDSYIGGRAGLNMIDLKRPVRKAVGAAGLDKRDANYEYEVHYKGQSKLERDYGDADTYNHSIDDQTIIEMPKRSEPVAALDLTITSDRYSSVKTHARIWEDELDENGKSKLDRTGVLFGRNLSNSDDSNCDYWMRSLLMSRTGSFGVKRKGSGFVIFGIEKKDRNGNVKTVMVREKMYGEQKKCIYFEKRGTCYVGDIRFDFEVPCCRDEAADNDIQIVGFYDDAVDDRTANGVTRAYI